MCTVYMNFRQNFSQKKVLAETLNGIPKGLRKGNPFHGPSAQLSHVLHCPHGEVPVEISDEVLEPIA